MRIFGGSVGILWTGVVNVNALAAVAVGHFIGRRFRTRRTSV